MLKALYILSRSTATLVIAAACIAVFAAGADWHLSSWGATAAQPWRLAAYSLVHTRGEHLAINIAGLLIFGARYESCTSPWRLAAVFASGAIAGGSLFEIASTLSGNSSMTLCGASAAVIAVICACQTDRRSRFPIWGLSPFFLPMLLAINCITGLFGENPGGNIAHLGGLATGIVLGLAANRRPGHGSGSHIIGKAQQSGYSSLTPEERDFLFNQNSTKK